MPIGAGSSEDRTVSINRKYIYINVLLLLILSACSYRFAAKGDLPSGVRRIFVTILENRTAETGVENIITNDLKQEIIRNRKEILASSSVEADAFLSGVVKSIRIKNISHKGTHTSLERRVRVMVSLKLTDPDGRILWHENDIAESEAYVVTPDKSETDRNRRAAISALSKRLAESVYYRLTDDF